MRPRTKPIALVCVGGPVHEETFVVSPTTATITVPRLDRMAVRAFDNDGELHYTEHVYRVSELTTPAGATPTRLYLRYVGARTP